MNLQQIAGLGAALIALTFGLPSPSRAQDWPSKPVKIVVAFAPGGAADLFARMLAAEMSSTFKQQFYVENIPGSAGAIGSGRVARARPDGYTLLIGGAGPLLTSPARRIVRLPEIRRRFESDALVTMDIDAAALAGIIAKEVATWGPLAKDIGLRVQ